jgi:hypothetical protein
MNPALLAKTVTLDFETYYDQQFSLSKLTYSEYVHDPRFHIHGVALRHPDGRCEFAWDATAAINALRQQYGEHLEAVTVIMHNAHFDGYILAHHFALIPRFTLDTLQLANAIYGRRGNGVQFKNA